ncbi:MAG: YigZ family protein [Erysipelotrichaceae bacterium]|nr:YigZ family protein [Erysipelotrichaceae bacterium]
MRIKMEVENTIEIERSRFICYMERVFSEQEAKDYLQIIKKLHPNATHHCYAYIIGDSIQRSNDNGEPAGTAGIPILETLKKIGVEDCIAVVVRYFGGIKLGAGGLIRAYSKAVSEATKVATFTNIETRHKYKISFGYDLIGKMEFHLKDDVDIIDKEYDEKVTFTYLCKEPIDTRIQELTNGQFTPEYIETLEVEVTLKEA